MQNIKKDLSLYIHIPFCKSKCFYCDFNSFVCRDDIIPAYFNALKKEISLYGDILGNYRINTVFIGGGTPSYVSAHNIYEIMQMVNQLYYIDEKAEITLEANPGTLSHEKLVAYKMLGINRLSIGLQAIQNSLLKELGRIHTVEEFADNYNLCRKIGFTNVNIDLIFGIPGQSIDDWIGTINYIRELKPSHISAYSLKIEEGTVLGDRFQKGDLELVDDTDDRLMYKIAVENLKEEGYRHYEISNFAKKGFECRHNLVYWKEHEYVGIGAGAHSFINSERYNNACDLKEYIKSLGMDKLPKENMELISERDKMCEFMMLGLRLIEGVDTKEFRDRFGEDVFKVFETEIFNITNKGLAVLKDNFLKLTPLGLDIANQAFMEFV
jgi:oxygen-independent coproporphyrinogen-3 oxidase